MMQFANRVQQIKPSPTLALNACAKKMQAGGVNVINFTCGEPDFDTPEHIKQAAIKAINEGFTKYTPVEGISELKDAIRNFLKREQGLDYARDEIITTAGAKHAILLAMQVLLNKGDEVLIPAPYWVSYPDQVLLCDATPKIMPTNKADGLKITPNQLETAITRQTKILILNSPSNPTGAAYTENEIKKLAAICIRHNLFVISDEIYDGIVFDGFRCKSIASVNGMKELAVIVNGVSKRYAMTGWRMGFAAAQGSFIAKMGEIQGQSTTCVTSFTQKATIAAYDSPQDKLNEMLHAFNERRNYMIDRLNKMGLKCERPQGAFYAFPDVSGILGKTLGGKKMEHASDISKYWLETAHVATVPGEAFGLDGYIRLSYATSLENITEGLNRIERNLI